MNHKNETGEFLAEAREKAKISQWELAKKLNYLSPQFVSNIERGISSFPVSKIRVACRVLEINPKELIKRMQNDILASAEQRAKNLSRYL